MSTQNIPFLNVKNKIILNHPKSATIGLFQGTQERVRNSHGKRAISVRAIEVPLYIIKQCAMRPMIYTQYIQRVCRYQRRVCRYHEILLFK